MAADPFGRRCADADPVPGTRPRRGRIVCFHHRDPGRGVWVLWDGVGAEPGGRPVWYPTDAVSVMPPPGGGGPLPLSAALLAALPTPRPPP